MNTVHFGTASEGVDIELLDVDTHPAVAGNLHIRVSVRTNEFLGHSEALILHDAWPVFIRELGEFEKTRQGSVTLKGVDANALRLTLRSTDRSGHMAIDGLVGLRTGVREVILQFSPIEFDPSTLAGILRRLTSFPQMAKQP